MNEEKQDELKREYQEKRRDLNYQYHLIDHRIDYAVASYRDSLKEKSKEEYAKIREKITKLDEDWQDISRTFTSNERAVSVRLDCMAA